MIPIESLKQINFLKEASKVSLDRLAQDMEQITYAVGEFVLKEGKHSDAIYVIASGVARVEKKLDKSGDRTKVVARLQKEEIFGEMSFLENKPLSASVVADTELVVYVLHRDALEKVAKTDSSAALDQVLTIFSGISGRLRRTTTELVTVYEVARLLMQDSPFVSTIQSVLNQLYQSLGETTSVAFYKWNPFNDEYDLVAATETSDVEAFLPQLPKISESRPPILALKPIEFSGQREGLLALSSKTVFDSGAQQMVDTVSGLLAPALATWRHREEEAARHQFEQRRQENFYS